MREQCLYEARSIKKHEVHSNLPITLTPGCRHSQTKILQSNGICRYVAFLAQRQNAISGKKAYPGLKISSNQRKIGNS